MANYFHCKFTQNYYPLQHFNLVGSIRGKEVTPQLVISKPPNCPTEEFIAFKLRGN